MFLALSQGVSVNQFYGFHDKLKTVLQNHEKIKLKLLDIVKENTVTVTLSNNDPYIAKWEKSVEDTSRGLVLNSSNSMLFSDVPHVKFTCSKIELDDIPIKIKNEMAVAFGISRKN